MLITKAYKFRMYPDIKQQELINKTIGCSRFIYNQMLAKKINNSYFSRFDLNKDYDDLMNGNDEYLQDVYQIAKKI